MLTSYSNTVSTAQNVQQFRSATVREFNMWAAGVEPQFSEKRLDFMISQLCSLSSVRPRPRSIWISIELGQIDAATLFFFNELESLGKLFQAS
jgi:hypothetical protein